MGLKDLKSQLSRKLLQIPQAAKIYFVGGCVRDELLGRETRDIDLVVEAPGGAQEVATALKNLDPDLWSGPRQLGRSYPIWQLVGDHLTLEIADTQKEMFLDPRSRERVTEFGSLSEDSKRRDLTINMLYQNVALDRVIDSSGLGLADLASKRIRLREDVDRGRVLSDDPLRILRLFRFQAQLGFQVDDALRPIVQANLGRLQILSGQRVRDELHKMFQCNDSHVALESLMEWGVIAEILPELLAMRGCEQDARYHSEGDVWVHTLRVMAEAPKTICQQWTALLHDVGKPATQSRLGDRIRFIGHEKVSHQMAQPIFERLFLPADLQNSVLQLIDLHLRGGDATQWTSAKPARKLMRDAGPLLDDLLQFIAADSRASLGPDLKPRLDHLNELDRWVSEAKSLGVPKTKALLNGNELMQLAQRGQGAWIAELSRALIEWEESLIQQQRAPTKEEAVVFARAWIEKQNSI